MEESPVKKAGGFSRILQVITETLYCIRIAFDIIRMLRTGIV